MMRQYSILHISDLHRIKQENVDCLMASFAVEKNRYTEMGIPPVGLIVVSGDIVNGSNQKDSGLAKQEIQQQYEIAAQFLYNLCALFIGNKQQDRLRVIIVPGNHDMSRYASILSMDEISHDDINTLAGSLWEDNTDIRWSWSNLHFYKITNKELYNQRFDDFITFYDKFYDGLRTYPKDPERQSAIIDIPELNITLACFNSCYRLDHLRYSGYISPRSLSMLTRPLLDAKIKGRMIVGVWHHHTRGLPNESNYLNYSILDNIAQNGIHLALHGHQHICGIANEYKDVFSDVKLSMISAGTLYGNHFDVPTTKTRQYNLLVVNMYDEHCDITVHSREDSTALNEMPAWSVGMIGRSRVPSYTFSVPISVCAAKSGEEELQERINQINLQMEKSGDIPKAVCQIESLGTDAPIVRKFLLDLLLRVDNHGKICEHFSSPQNLQEAIAVIDSCIKQSDKGTLMAVMASEFVRSSSDASLNAIIIDAKLQFKL